MLDRRPLVKALLEDRGDLLIVTGLGSPTYDVAAAGENPLNFYLWAGMGCAAMIGLGLALARPDRRVCVITGDGEALMGLGSLATIGVKQPKNLSIVVLDNQHYGETFVVPEPRIRDDVAAELHTPDLTARIRALGQEPIGSTVEEYNALIRNDMKRWEPIIKATGVRLD